MIKIDKYQIHQKSYRNLGFMFSSISATNNVLLLSYTNDGVLSYCESNQREKSLCESSECMVTRLPRFWEGRNVKKGGDFIGVGIVFLDEKSHLTQGTVYELY